MAEIQFYLAENVAGAVAKGLRRRGIDVLTVPEARTRGDDDPDQLALAHRLGRALFTHDSDHLALAAHGQPHCGIVFASQVMPVGACIRALEFIHQDLEAEDFAGKVEFI